MSSTPELKKNCARTPRSEGKIGSRYSELGDPKTPVTPKSRGRVRQGLWKSFNMASAMDSSYSEVGSVSSFIVGTPGALPTPGNRRRNQFTNIRHTIRHHLPEKFKQSMPARIEAAGTKNEAQSPHAMVTPIVTTSFYGKMELTTDTAETSVNEKLVESSPEKSPRKNFEMSDLAKSINSPSVSGPSAKNLPTNKGKSSSRRASTSGKKRSSVALKKKRFEINKGVGHAIRKPVFKKKSKAKVKKTLKQAIVKTATASEETQDLFASTVKPTKLLKPLPKKRGKISVADKARTVNFEIRNGFPVFRLREKSSQTPPIGSPYGNVSTRKTPAKLFTPSGSNDYLLGSPVSKTKRRGPALPSPVKFNLEETGDIDHPITDETVANLIETLEEDEANEDEAARIAAQTIQELESICNDDDMIENSSEILKSNKKSDAEIPRRSPRKKVESVNESIKSILSSLKPPTQEEIQTKRNVNQNPLSEIGNSVPKSASQFYPIFEKGFSSTATAPNSSSKKSKQKLNPTTGTKDNSELTQSFIDAGQKKIGAEYCKFCDFVYNVGDAEEEKLHQQKHQHALGIIKFSGWKNERVVRLYSDGRVILVRHGDPQRHWAKVDSLLQIVDQSLGITQGFGIRNPEQSKVYLFVADGHISGLLLSETISRKDKISRVVASGNNIPVLKDVDAEESKHVYVGISKLWVQPSFQRKHVATRMLDAMRADFVAGKFLKKSEFAFTHTTPAGTAFAVSYVGKPEFLAYIPESELDGN